MRVLSAIVGLFGVAATAVAAPGRVEAMTTLASSDRARLVLVALVALLALMGIWSTVSRAGVEALRGPVAKNLFLGVHVHGAGAEFRGHLLSLGPRGATLVSPKAVARGAAVTLDLAALPDFRGGPEPVAGEVTAERLVDAALSGGPATHVLTIRFKGLNPATRLPLLRLIQQLARDGRVARA